MQEQMQQQAQGKNTINLKEIGNVVTMKKFANMEKGRITLAEDSPNRRYMDGREFAAHGRH